MGKDCLQILLESLNILSRLRERTEIMLNKMCRRTPLSDTSHSALLSKLPGETFFKSWSVMLGTLPHALFCK